LLLFFYRGTGPPNIADIVSLFFCGPAMLA